MALEELIPTPLQHAFNKLVGSVKNIARVAEKVNEMVFNEKRVKVRSNVWESWKDRFESTAVLSERMMVRIKSAHTAGKYTASGKTGER